MRVHFHKCFETSGHPERKRARPYDLRHTFATNTLLRWIDEKQDVMSLLPYLSVYMGHVDIHGTLYYVHLLPERLQKTAGVDWAQLSAVYGEVRHEEN